MGQERLRRMRAGARRGTGGGPGTSVCAVVCAMGDPVDGASLATGDGEGPGSEACGPGPSLAPSGRRREA